MLSKISQVRISTAVWLAIVMMAASSVLADPNDLFAPVFVNRPQGTLYFSHCDTARYTFQAVSSATGLPSPFVRYRLVSGPGTIDSVTGEWKNPPTMDPDQFGTYSLAISAREFDLETEGLQDCFAQIQLENRYPSIYAYDQSPTPKVAAGDTLRVQFRVFEPDRCDSVTLYVEGVTSEFSGDIWITRGGYLDTLSIAPQLSDSGKLIDITITATDGFDTYRATFRVQVLPTPYFAIRVAIKRNQSQGEFVDVPVYLDRSIPRVGVGGFDLLFAYDNSGLAFQAALADSSGLYHQCQWEYFTYRFGAVGNCNDGCPSGLVRVVGIAETNNGTHHPICPPENLPLLPVEMFRLKFLVSNYPRLDCGFLPIQFFFVDCSDNSLSSADGRRLFVVDSVFENDTGSGEFTNITRANPILPTYNGLPPSCMVNTSKGVMERGIRLFGGGVDLVCADTIQLCGRYYEDIWPAYWTYVMYYYYFLYGYDSASIVSNNGLHCMDFDGDGRVMNLEDLVTLCHIMRNQWPAIRRFDSVTQPANLISGGSDPSQWYLSTADSLGAIFLKFEPGTEITLSDTSISAVYTFDPRWVRVLFAPKDPIFVLKMKSSLLLTARKDGHPTLPLSASAASYSGRSIDLIVDALTEVGSDNGVLPLSFALHQNYPNPFNPSTAISFDLPHTDVVKIEILNILGQTVWSRQERMGAGTQVVTWEGVSSDGSSVSSGVYYYRLTADDFTATKKMILMK